MLVNQKGHDVGKPYNTPRGCQTPPQNANWTDYYLIWYTVSHGMRNELALLSRTGVRASFMALPCARDSRAVPHATAMTRLMALSCRFHLTLGVGRARLMIRPACPSSL